MSPLARFVHSGADAVSGQPLPVQWTVHNSGPGNAAGAWYDALYLSADPVPDTADTQLAHVITVEQLEPSPNAAIRYVASLVAPLGTPPQQCNNGERGTDRTERAVPAYDVTGGACGQT